MNLGFPEIIVILFVILIVFGPSRLPELSRALGRSVREFKRAMSDLQAQIETATTETPADAPTTPQSALPESVAVDPAASAQDAECQAAMAAENSAAPASPSAEPPSPDTVRS